MHFDKHQKIYISSKIKIILDISRSHNETYFFWKKFILNTDFLKQDFIGNVIEPL